MCIRDSLKAAEEMLSEGNATDAAQTFSAIIQEDPNNVASYAGLVKAHLMLNDLSEAEAILNGAPAEISDAPELEAVRAQLELAKQAENAGPVDDLKAAVQLNADDHKARLELATALHAAGETNEAVSQLLELFQRDRDWNEGAAKVQLLNIFDALPDNDAIALNGRRKLSSLIFA